MRYNKKILEYFHNKKHFIGKFNDNKNVGIGEVGALACGDILKLFIKIENNNIVDVRVMVFGCLSAFASSTYLAEMLIGKSVYSAFEITNQQIANALGLPPIKIHCSVLAQEALQMAIKNYFVKNNMISNNSYSVGEGYFERKKIDIDLQKDKNEDKDIEKKNQNIFSCSEIGLNLSGKAFYKLKNFFSDKLDCNLFLYVERNGCGFIYKYKIIKNELIKPNYCVIDCKKFNIVFLNQQYSYIQNIYIDFVEKDLVSYLLFKKEKDVQYCYCGNAFNIKINQ